MLKEETIIIIADDDDGHVSLIRRNLERVGIHNQVLHFKDGQETMDFLMGKDTGSHHISGSCYLLLLDIRMPKIDGIEVLRQLKRDNELRKIPVIMMTTTDDPREVEKCHSLGCSSYIVKPVIYDRFVEIVRQLGLFLQIVEVPKVNGEFKP